MLKKIAIIATIIVGVTSFIYMMSSFSLSEVFQPFSNASITSILVFIAVSFLMSATLTLRWHIITKSFNLKIPFWSLYSVRLAGYPVGYLTPGPRVGGEPVMASLLKKKGVPFIKSISTLVIDRTIEGTMLGTFFIIGLLVVLLNFALPAKTKIIMIFVAILFALAIFYFYYRTLQGHDFFHKILRVLRLNKLKFIKKYESKIFAFEKVLISFYNKQKKHSFSQYCSQ